MGAYGRDTNMGLLVLDSSGLIGTSQSSLASVGNRHEFLVLPDLFTELYTHKEKDQPFSKDRASQRAYNQIAKVDSLVCREHSIDPIQFEIERGRSATVAPTCLLRVPSCPPKPSRTESEDMLTREKQLGSFWNFQHPCQCTEAFQELRRLRADCDLWPHISDFLVVREIASAIRNDAITFFSQMAQHNGWSVSRSFCPDRHWLTFGASLTKYAYMIWKFARHGDNIPEPSKPANPSYDMIYVAHMAICDGLLSGDKTMLKIAWSCWPEKRKDIYTYDVNAKIVPYAPEWET